MPLYTRIAQVHAITSLWNQINYCNLGDLVLARIRLAHLFLECGSIGHRGRYKEVPLFFNSLFPNPIKTMVVDRRRHPFFSLLPPFSTFSSPVLRYLSQA
jgi:hypothetical protein